MTTYTAPTVRNRTPWFAWILLGLVVLLIIGMIIGGIFLARQLRQISVANTDSGAGDTGLVTDDIPVRIPGKGSQKDHSGGIQFARIEVHDDEAANEYGWYDRTIINTEDPTEIGLEDSFTVPEGWTVERDYSLAKQAYQPYFTVKPNPTVTMSKIEEWAEENDLIQEAYEVTSVVVDTETGQECSVRGLSDSRIRTNIYVGENFVYQLCPPTQDN